MLEIIILNLLDIFKGFWKDVWKLFFI